MKRFSNGVMWAALLFFAAAYCLVFLAHGACLWYTKLESWDALSSRYTHLLTQPKIGQQFHFNGQIWRVIATRRDCK